MKTDFQTIQTNLHSALYYSLTILHIHRTCKPQKRHKFFKVDISNRGPKIKQSQSTSFSRLISYDKVRITHIHVCI